MLIRKPLLVNTLQLMSVCVAEAGVGKQALFSVIFPYCREAYRRQIYAFKYLNFYN